MELLLTLNRDSIQVTILRSPSWAMSLILIVFTANLLLKFGRIQFQENKGQVFNSDEIMGGPCCRCPLLFKQSPHPPPSPPRGCKRCKQWNKNKWAQQVVLLLGSDPGPPQLSATQICKDVQTSGQDDPCHNMSSMTQVLNNARQKTCPRGTILSIDFRFRWTELMLAYVYSEKKQMPLILDKVH